MADLSGLSLGEWGRVKSVKAQRDIYRRLLDLGFTPGAKVECALMAPGKRMRAYFVRSSLVALRTGDAKTIQLSEVCHGQHA